MSWVSKRSVVGGFVLVVIASMANGFPLPIQGGDFENPQQRLCAFGFAPLGGWNGLVGVWRVGTEVECNEDAYPNGLPAAQEEQIAFVNNGMLTYVACPIVPFTRYVVQVDVGRRADNTANGSYKATMWAGAANTVLLAQDDSTQVPPRGGFVTATVVFDALDVGSLGVGDDLVLTFQKKTSAQANFDNVRLNAYDIDCNDNGVVDATDIANGLLPDADGDGIADDCDNEGFVVPDLNGDAHVNGADLGLLLAAWGPCTAETLCVSDFNGDCTTDGADLGLLLSAWTG